MRSFGGETKRSDCGKAASSEVVGHLLSVMKGHSVKLNVAFRVAVF